MKVFVYGTLKKGCGNHAFLRGAQYLGQDRAPGRLYVPENAPGHYPFALQGGSDWIKGEVYSVQSRTLEALDRLEGHPNYYERRSVYLESGKQASLYYLNVEKHGGLVNNLVAIPDGEWKGNQA